jgi:hypothetical protein
MDIQHQIAVVDNDFADMVRSNPELYPSGSHAFPNQENTADEILKFFKKPKSVMATLIAEPQSGKTGIAVDLVYKLSRQKSTRRIFRGKPIIDYNNIFVISGMNDLGWRDQTRERFPYSIKTRIYHRSDLGKFAIEFKACTGKRCLIILDECHIAAKSGQILAGLFVDLGLTNVKTLRAKGHKIIQISATPDATLVDARTWGPRAHRVFIPATPPSYTGVRQFKAKGCFKELVNLSDLKNIYLMFGYFYTVERPQYHLFRLNNCGNDNIVIRANFIRMARANNCDIVEYDSSHMNEDKINMLDTEPEKHTIVMLKRRLGAAKTVNTEHVGIVYETARDSSSEIQGLVGRMCGHHWEGRGHLPVIYCSLLAVNNYITLIENNFDYTDPSLMWKSNTFKTGSRSTTTSKTHVNGPRKRDALDLILLRPDYVSPRVEAEFEYGLEEKEISNDEERIKGLDALRKSLMKMKVSKKVTTVIPLIFELYDRVRDISMSKVEMEKEIRLTVQTGNLDKWNLSHSKRSILVQGPRDYYSINIKTLNCVMDILKDSSDGSPGIYTIVRNRQLISNKNI